MCCVLRVGQAAIAFPDPVFSPELSVLDCCLNQNGAFCVGYLGRLHQAWD
ncbi:MAG TPA: hypothetical protein V6D43_14235 [Candidatus Sericytochromatia bacterium]